MSSLNISYIIPAYNCMETIEESVSSIFDGNFVLGDEIIIVDDYSTDQTKQVMTNMKRKFPQVQLVFHTKNKGGGAARNTAAQAARNKLIFCLDSDNILYPNSVRFLRRKFNKVRSGVVSFGQLHYFNGDRRQVSHNWVFKFSRYNKQNYLQTNIVPGASGNYLFTKESWLRAGGYPEDSGALDTWGFGLRQIMTGTSMTVVPNTFYYHRIGIESYWVRESRITNFNKVARKLLLPYASDLDFFDFCRIYLRPGSQWFLSLDKQPIRIGPNTRWQAVIIDSISKLLRKCL